MKNTEARWKCPPGRSLALAETLTKQSYEGTLWMDGKCEWARYSSGGYMKMKPKNQEADESEMRPEYDFKGGVRGKHAKACLAGYTVRVTQPDGSVVERRHPPEEGAVILEPDVRRFFPDSESVNEALRSLIKLIPKKRKSA